MAILSVLVIINTTAFLLICTASSVNLAVAWVFPPQRRYVISTRFRRNSEFYLGAQRTRRIGIDETAEVNAASANTDSWDNQAIRWVDGILEGKSEQSPFANEATSLSDNHVTYEWIAAPDNINKGVKNSFTDTPRNNIALFTTGDPLLDAEAIALIRGTAENLWERQKSSRALSSRFTLQFEDTNLECHLEELVAFDASGKLQQVVDNLLTNKVYPLVRSAFGGDTDDRFGLTDGNLCIYDSLVVRYNGDKAIDRFGASQPLHGDGGVVSVNIALNSFRGEEEDETLDDTFSGGGTFFEDMIQLNGEDIERGNGCGPILRPSFTGHALAHWSIHRHAGAPTRSGTRDILVIFLTQKKAPSQALFNGIERSFQLKLKSRELSEEQRDMALRCVDLAIEKCPFDAQAHFWKGFYLIQGGSTTPRDADSMTSVEDITQKQRWKDLCQSIDSFEKARDCAPFDAKISCYAGIAYRQRWMFAQQYNPLEKRIEDLESAASCLEHALLLHEKYRMHNISSDFDDKANTAKITLAEVYLQREQYETALDFLAFIVREEETELLMSEAMKQHISKLNDHCLEQLEASEQKQRK